MSLTTQLVIADHLPVQEICHRLRTRYAKGAVSARPQRASDHWTIELQNPAGEWQAIDVFLNSYAADDHVELGIPQSTLVTAQLGPDSEAMVSSIVAEETAWIRKHEGEDWRSVGKLPSPSSTP